MKASEDCIRLIKHFEGFRSEPYQCQAGVWTIGYGHTRGITEDTAPITQQQADDLLLFDIIRFENTVNKLITLCLSKNTGLYLKQNQFDALVSFTFNLGGGALQRSSLRQKLNRGDYSGAANEFMKWVRAGGKISRGLVIRRSAERDLFLQ